MLLAQPARRLVPTVRWIFPGHLVGAVTGWFGRFPAETTALEDAYLLDLHLPGLSVKIRGRRALEVKAYRGSPGLPGSSRTSTRPPAVLAEVDLPARPAQHRQRRPGWLAAGAQKAPDQLVSQATGLVAPRLGREQRCAVKLTEVHVRGEPWWALRFEATGPAHALSGELNAAAALLFARALPDGIELGRVTPSPTHSGCADSRMPAR
jgi:hypothetical protein